MQKKQGMQLVFFLIRVPKNADDGASRKCTLPQKKNKEEHMLVVEDAQHKVWLKVFTPHGMTPAPEFYTFRFTQWSDVDCLQSQRSFSPHSQRQSSCKFAQPTDGRLRLTKMHVGFFLCHKPNLWNVVVSSSSSRTIVKCYESNKIFALLKESQQPSWLFPVFNFSFPLCNYVFRNIARLE